MKNSTALLLVASQLPLILNAEAASPVVSNVRAAQRPGTKLVDILYDVADADGGTVTVEVNVSGDGGLTYLIPASSLTGAVGAGVSLGTNRQVVWNAGADWGGNFIASTKIRVTAHDGSSPAAPFGMAFIPGGPFQMGDTPGFNVQVSGFFIDRTEVTAEVFNSIRNWANNNGYSIASAGSGGPDFPLQSISWYDAVKWCNAKSEREGLTPVYFTNSSKSALYRSGNVDIETNMVDWTANGYRLPTEAEWEKAARGGRTGQVYPWGDTWNSSFAQASGTVIKVAVKSFPPNDFGLYDMTGNIAEWTWDRYSGSYYGTPGSDSDPKGPDVGTARVIRSLAWNGVYGYYYVGQQTCASRSNLSPSTANTASGFRAARNAP